MAADPLQHVDSGTPLVEAVTADVLNALKSQARHVRDLRAPSSSAGARGAGNPIVSGLTVLVRNDSGEDRASGSVLIVASTPLDPVGQPLDFMRRPALNAALATGEAGQVVILREPVRDGKFGRATIAGVAVCDVQINSSAHEWARPIAADASKLTSAASGPARILWKAGSSGTVRCVVNLLDGAGVFLSNQVTVPFLRKVCGTGGKLTQGEDLIVKLDGVAIGEEGIDVINYLENRHGEFSIPAALAAVVDLGCTDVTAEQCCTSRACPGSCDVVSNEYDWTLTDITGQERPFYPLDYYDFYETLNGTFRLRMVYTDGVPQCYWISDVFDYIGPDLPGGTAYWYMQDFGNHVRITLMVSVTTGDPYYGVVEFRSPIDSPSSFDCLGTTDVAYYQAGPYGNFPTPGSLVAV